MKGKAVQGERGRNTIGKAKEVWEYGGGESDGAEGSVTN